MFFENTIIDKEKKSYLKLEENTGVTNQNAI